MKIALNVSLLNDAHLRGWNRYTVSLILGLKKSGITLCLYSRKPVHPDFVELFGKNSIAYRNAPSANYFFWEQFILPSWCEKDRVDILHSPFNYGLPVKGSFKKILTLHDAIEEKFYRPKERLRDKLRISSLKYRLLQNSAPKIADHLITVSFHAKGDIKEAFSIADEKISVIYEAHPKEFETKLSPQSREETLLKYHINFPYFFYIGGFEHRKNIDFLLKAFAAAKLPEHRLVLAGNGDTENIKRIASALGINSFLHLTGYVEDSDLPAFYQGADAFVYPSLYEGFGLQVCESMASGCPTLVSDKGSLPEILSGGGLIFDLEDSSHLEDMLRKISQKPDLKDQLSGQAKKRSAYFSWDKTVLQTIEIYKKILNKN